MFLSSAGWRGGQVGRAFSERPIRGWVLIEAPDTVQDTPICRTMRALSSQLLLRGSRVLFFLAPVELPASSSPGRGPRLKSPAEGQPPEIAMEGRRSGPTDVPAATC